MSASETAAHDASFDVVYALTVMEHFQNPFVATAEVHRVLKPAGRFIGTVEQLVPMHMDSFYNMTAYGIFNVLVSAGLHPLVISPSTGWTGVAGLLSGSYWPGVPRAAKGAAIHALDALSFVMWKLRARIKGQDTANLRLDWMVKFAGGFKFVAEKAADPQAEDV